MDQADISLVFGRAEIMRFWQDICTPKHFLIHNSRCDPINPQPKLTLIDLNSDFAWCGNSLRASAHCDIDIDLQMDVSYSRGQISHVATIISCGRI